MLRSALKRSVSLLGLVVTIVWRACRKKVRPEVPSEGYSTRDGYSSPTQRDRWTMQLQSESESPVRVAYHPLGHLAGLAGGFPLGTSGSEAVADWLEAHAEILGLPPGVRLLAGQEEPFYELEASAIRQAHQAAESAPEDEPSFAFDAEAERHAGTIYSFEVVHEGHRFIGLPLSGIVASDRPVLRGIYNGFSPAIQGFGPVAVSPEASAWAAAERATGSPLTKLAAAETWFDASWALNRVPATKELHWRLQGLDQAGLLRHVFVRCADDAVVFATPNLSTFGYEVQQTHTNDARNVLWDSVNLPNGCTSGMPGCSGQALAESIKSRDIFPRTVDLWYRLSSPSPPPFVWPFAGAHKAPLDNRGNPISVVVNHVGSVGYPERNGKEYFFPFGMMTEDFVGHEYGHVILGELKTIHPGGQSAIADPATGKVQTIPPAAFTEAMCDFIGIVTEDVIFSERWSVSTDFQIGKTQWGPAPESAYIAPAPVSWPLKTGNCNGYGRERIGHAFYNAWKWVEWWYGDRPRAVRNANFRAWWIDVMRSFALVGDFPDIVDFYAATTSRLGMYTLIEAGVSYRLALELENLGLQNGCY